MAKIITLQSMRDALEDKYGHTVVSLSETESVTLLNPNRLPPEKRDKLLAFEGLISSVEEGDVEAQVALIRDLILTVAETEAAGRKLLKAVDSVPGDATMILTDLLGEYMGAQGETSPSES